MGWFVVTPTEAGECFNQAIIEWGQPLRVRYFTEAYDTGSYDDTVTLTRSGVELYISGVVQPLDSEEGSKDAILLQQGRVKQDDQILYLVGSIQTSGALQFGLGSPPAEEFGIVPNGIITWSVQGNEIYKKVYIRRLTTGSIFG